MKTRSFIIAAIFAILLTFYSNTAQAQSGNTSIISNGRITYDNETPDDASDDTILFDASDILLLETKINNLEASL